MPSRINRILLFFTNFTGALGSTMEAMKTHWQTAVTVGEDIVDNHPAVCMPSESTVVVFVFLLCGALSIERG